MALTFTTRAAGELRGAPAPPRRGRRHRAHLPLRRPLAAQLLLAAARRRAAAGDPSRQGPHPRPRRRIAQAACRHRRPARPRRRDRVAQGATHPVGGICAHRAHPRDAARARRRRRRRAAAALRGAQGRASSPRLRGCAARHRRHDRRRAAGGAIRCASSTGSSSSTSTRTSRRCSSELLELWLGPRTDLCVVGDASQTIYSFAGASSEYLLGFGSRYPDATVVRLETNYRSVPGVLQAANRLMRGRPGALELHVGAATAAWSPTRPSRGGTRMRPRPRGVADVVAEQVASGIRPEQIAVLYRVNAQAAILEGALAAPGDQRPHTGRHPVLRPRLDQARHARAHAASPAPARRSPCTRRSRMWRATSAGRWRHPRARARCGSAGRRSTRSSNSPIRRRTGMTLAAFVAELQERQGAQHEPTDAGGRAVDLPRGEGPRVGPRAPRGAQRGAAADLARARGSTPSTRSGGCSTWASRAPDGRCRSPGRARDCGGVRGSPVAFWRSCAAAVRVRGQRAVR